MEALGTVVGRDVLAAEARRRGYDRHISPALVRDEVAAKLKPEDVSGAEVQRSLQEHEASSADPRGCGPA